MSDNLSRDAEWIVFKSGISHLPLDISVPKTQILEEWNLVKDKASPHRKTDGSFDPRFVGWNSLELYAPEKTETTVSSDRNGFVSTDKHVWKDVAKYCPITVRWFKDTFGEDNFVGRIYFSLLEPGGKIAVHRDSRYSNLHGANVAITNPVGCHFHNERAGIIDFDSNPVNMMNLYDKHWVVNNSSKQRLHIIYSGKVPAQIIERSYKKMMEKGNKNV